MTDGRNPELDEHLYNRVSLSSTYRIEALRAASRVVASERAMRSGAGTLVSAVDETLHVAEQFARWLEEGK